MIVRSTEDVRDTAHDASGPGWSSLRLLTKADGMGFSVNDTLCKAGQCLTLQYKNHLEACFCLSGTGTLTNLATGERHVITPGVIYALDQNDAHRLEVDAAEDMRLVSVFNPALSGDEVHGADGSYGA